MENCVLKTCNFNISISVGLVLLCGFFTKGRTWQGHEKLQDDQEYIYIYINVKYPLFFSDVTET